MRFSPYRRLMLKLMASSAALPLAMPVVAAFGQDLAGRIIILSDLHSAYERTGQLLAAVEAEIAGNAAPHLIFINGDVFEAGNVVASRSQGAIDWAFVEALGKLAPTVLNIGNHEPDLATDLADVVSKAKEMGITVISNIVDARSGAGFTEPSAKLALGDLPVKVVGIATNAVGTYPAAVRETLDIPEAPQWAEENLPALLDGEGLSVVLSHAGVVADRAMLPMLADGTLLIGGHDHLLFEHEEGRTRYVHTGSWSSVYTVAEIGADQSITLKQVTVDAEAAPSPVLGELIAATLAEHMTAEELAEIGTSPAAMTLAETGRFVAKTMAAGAEGDIGFIGHTTLGTGLPAGPVSKYAFDAVVRFDGKLVVAEVDAATLAEILAVCNQDEAKTLEQRTGDFLYAAPADLPTRDSYRLVTNDWSATNQKSYFGREDLVFTPGPDIALKALVVDALKA